MKIVIIKYNAGNIRSVDFALQRLGVSALISDNPQEIRSADRVIFPGVGEASTTMKFLSDHKLDTLICDLKQPVLGICLGLQLMCTHSEEGDTSCLGLFFFLPLLHLHHYQQNIACPFLLISFCHQWTFLRLMSYLLFTFLPPYIHHSFHHCLLE